MRMRTRAGRWIGRPLDVVGLGIESHRRWLATWHERLDEALPEWDERLPVRRVIESAAWHDAARGAVGIDMIAPTSWRKVSPGDPTIYVGGEQPLLCVLLRLRRLGVPNGFVTVQRRSPPLRTIGGCPTPEKKGETSESTGTNVNSAPSRATE